MSSSSASPSLSPLHPPASPKFQLKVSAALPSDSEPALLSDGEEEIVLDSLNPLELLGADGHLSLASRGLTCVPSEVFSLPELAGNVRGLDLTGNKLDGAAQGLALLPNLQRLVLDCNALTEASFQDFPALPALDTLWVNGNQIRDVALFLDHVAPHRLPKLAWLSLLKNPCCPNHFTGRDEQDYARHRLFVLHRLPALKYLDAQEVTPSERAEAARVGHLMKTARGQNVVSQSSSSSSSSSTSGSGSPSPGGSVGDELESQGLSPLPLTITKPGKGATTFGVSRYVYYGRQSEGNRFIRDDAL